MRVMVVLLAIVGVMALIYLAGLGWMQAQAAVIDARADALDAAADAAIGTSMVMDRILVGGMMIVLMALSGFTVWVWMRFFSGRQRSQRSYQPQRKSERYGDVGLPPAYQRRILPQPPAQYWQISPQGYQQQPRQDVYYLPALEEDDNDEQIGWF